MKKTGVTIGFLKRVSLLYMVVVAFAGPVMVSTNAYAAEASNASYRWYSSANSLTPGSPIADTNTAGAVLTGSDFRLRYAFKERFRSPESLSLGSDHACGISMGKAYCWGSNDYGQSGVIIRSPSDMRLLQPTPVSTNGILAGKTIADIDAGIASTCAIADGKAYCWGYNAGGILGNNSINLGDMQVPPIAVDTTGVLAGKTLTSISVGTGHACALDTDGKAYCWGYGGDSYGQLGNGATGVPIENMLPVAVDMSGVLSGKKLKYIEAGGYDVVGSHSCALDTDGKAYCWGYGSEGLGQSPMINSRELSPLAVNMGALGSVSFEKVTVGIFYSCGLTNDNKVYCWGRNQQGQLGNGSTTTSLPRQIDMSGALAGKKITDISSSGLSSCVIADEKAYCWGSESTGGLGSSLGTSLSPVAVDQTGILAGKNIVSLASTTRSYFNCATDIEGAVYCWGGNKGFGVRGDGVQYSTTGADYKATAVTRDLMTVSGTKYTLQYARKTAASCDVSSLSYQPVTGSSTIAFSNSLAVSSGTNITSTPVDPIATNDSAPQKYVANNADFSTSSDIVAGKYSLWDFPLRDNGAGAGSYCFRAVQQGSVLSQYVYLPEMTLFEPGGTTVNSATSTTGKAVIQGSFDAANTAKLTVTMDGVSYVLGESSALTAKGNIWTLDLSGSKTFARGVYEVTATAQTKDGAVKISKGTFTVLGDATTTSSTGEKLAHTGQGLYMVVAVSMFSILLSGIMLVKKYRRA